jgi:hypothetical protein
MFIVKKLSHDADFMQSPFEIERVSSEESVIRYFTERGLYKTPSKVIVGVIYNSFCNLVRTHSH